MPDAAFVVTAGSVLASVTAFATLAWKLFSWVARQKQLEERVDALQQHQSKSESSVNEEQALIVYGLLACLKGLQELECDGPVTDAVNLLESHINAKAHSQR